MTQALYAHMNNKTIKKMSVVETKVYLLVHMKLSRVSSTHFSVNLPLSLNNLIPSSLT
jgi:hypothetical protein